MHEPGTQPILLNAHTLGSLRRRTLRRRLDDLAKRLLDVLVSVMGLVLLSPFLLIISWWIKKDAPGPVFYRGRRSGLGGKPFNILKFRTMHESQESYLGPRVTALDDPRVTKAGRWLRETKINELPQLWNVLKGEMSLVGPRPEDPHITATWPEEAKQEVLSVRPGISSPASVLYRNEEAMLQGAKVMDTYLKAILPSKLRLDQLYVRHRSLLLDLDILLWTFLVVMAKGGAATPPEEQLFLGPFTRLVRRYVRWFMIDGVVTLIAIGITGIFWRSFGPLNVGVVNSLGIAFGFAVLYSLVGAALGVNKIEWSRADLADAFDLIPPVMLATVIALFINRVLEDQPMLPVVLIIMAAVLSYVGFVFARFRSRLVRRLVEKWLNTRGSALNAQERVLVIGGGESGQFMTWWLNNGRNEGLFRIVGYVDDDLYKKDTRIRGVNVLGNRQDIPRLVEEYDVGIILFAIHNIPASERNRLLDICHATPARIYIVPDVLANLRQVARVQDNVEMEMAGETLDTKFDLQNWLDSLESKAQDGDLQGLQEQIRQMRDKWQQDFHGVEAEE